MYYTKSFCNVSALLSNEPGQNSPLGELTPFAKTFTKELGQYHSSTIDGYDLFNFSSREGDRARPVDPVVVNQAIAMVDRLVQTTLARVGELYVDELQAMLVSRANEYRVSDIKLGAMVTDGRHWLPAWVSWSDSVSGSANNHKVWLSIDAFLRQYTDFEIVVVPPFDNVDDFFLPGSLVEQRLKAITPSQMMERSEAAKGQFPETFRRTETYPYHDTNNSARIVDTHWTVLIYGAAGNSPDLIQEAIAEYVLANSSRPRSDWVTLLPDIFKRTEFVFVPMFDRFASGQRLLSHGVYSPIFSAGELLNYVEKYAPSEYPRAHVRANAQALGWPYRSLATAVIGNIENRDGKFKISDLYADYINVPTDDTDINRMSQATQEWALMMGELIVLAEGWSESTDLPVGTYIVERDGRIFLGRSKDRVLMLVMTKREFDRPTP